MNSQGVIFGEVVLYKIPRNILSVSNAHCKMGVGRSAPRVGRGKQSPGMCIQVAGSEQNHMNAHLH